MVKHFKYEESLTMLLITRYPQIVKPETVTKYFAVNVDFPETFLDYTGIDMLENMQGTSLQPVLEKTHRVMIKIYVLPLLGSSIEVDESRVPEWELFDLNKDP